MINFRSNISSKLGSRTGKQCRERYLNHLNPAIKKGEWTQEEDDRIMELNKTIGNKWCKYIDYLPGRTDCAIKNRFHVLIRSKRSGKMKEGLIPSSPSRSNSASSFKAEAKSPSLVSEECTSCNPSPTFTPLPTPIDQNNDHTSRDGIAEAISKDAMDVVDSSTTGIHNPTGLCIQIPEEIERSGGDNSMGEIYPELLELCSSPMFTYPCNDAPQSASTASTQPVAYSVERRHQNLDITSRRTASRSLNMHQAALLSMQTPIDPLALQSCSFDLHQFSPHYLSSRLPLSMSLSSSFILPMTQQSSRDALQSNSSACWYNTFSPQSLSYLGQSPLTPMLYAFDTSPQLPQNTKRQRLVYPAHLPIRNDNAASAPEVSSPNFPLTKR